MFGRIHKFTNNFHVPRSVQKLPLETWSGGFRSGQHTSCSQAQRTDFMGSLLCKCRIIVMCSVNVRGQAWRAFQIEGERGRVQSQGRYGRFVSSNTCIESQIIRESIQYNYGITF